MDEIRVNKANLIETLKQNRDKHREIFEEALEGYRKAVIEKLEQRVADAKANRRRDSWHIIGLNQPSDHTGDYNRVIGMLELSLDDEVMLSVQEYTWYVQDEWGWRGQFLTTNSYYSATAAATLDGMS